MHGAFTVYSRPGKAMVNVWQFADKYVGPALGRPSQTIDISKDVTLEPIRLEWSSPFEGIVVDKSGKPVADAEIRYNSLDMISSLPMDANVRSDAAGKFVLKNIPRQQTISIRHGPSMRRPTR